MNILLGSIALVFTVYQLYDLKFWLKKRKERYKSKKIGASEITPLTTIVACILLGIITTVFFFLKSLDATS
ncbi:hypothetical protein [Aequorivita sinensis]|uniref:hypothetical protein n=1 Tax=Aequorivita sinensis TaxID=1382458 RepID=UPI0011230128|nr:hypothetical protein [Aequorivita sinensis]